MKTLSSPKTGRPDWSKRAFVAVDVGDLATAKHCFLEAVRADPRDARHRLHLAVVLEAVSEFEAAATHLTKALRLDPKLSDAARRLSGLARRSFGRPFAPMSLDPMGLKAALLHETIDRDVVGEFAVRHLVSTTLLGTALAQGKSQGWLPAARRLCLTSTNAALKDDLFLEVLRRSVLMNPDLERLLTALRAVLLLELPAERFADRALVNFSIALLRQCWLNEHLWSVASEETRVLETRGFSLEKLLSGNVEAGRVCLLACLYRPLQQVLGAGVEPRQATNIRPRALGEVVVGRLTEAQVERERGARMPKLTAVTDATSIKVAAQYATNPYPRWISIGPLRPNMQQALCRYFQASELGFMQRPFEVLIAGCGTGQQAVQAALAYGANARVLAVDLSAASLSYAARMAEHFGVHNIEFGLADLHELSREQPKFIGRFDVIECIGVLHHMAEPLRGWRSLMRCLSDKGIMYLGLYSALSRRNLDVLRNDPAYPGPGCSLDQLRSFRQVLLDRSEGEAGSELKISPDFYTASNFRDLTLHVSERCLTLPEIGDFLDENGLKFRGFNVDKLTFSLFLERFPLESWPGSLGRWSEFEQVNPTAFNSMYNFWCSGVTAAAS